MNDFNIGFTGHPNSYVRQSTARSLKESLEIWPGQTNRIIEILQEFYRDKVN